MSAWFRAGASTPEWAQLPRDRTIVTHQGRTAIALGCTMLGLEAGDEVLVPSWNCGTEAEAILAAGPSVVLYRVDERGRIDVADLASRVTGRTRAVYVIHYFGWPQDVSGVHRLCRDSGLFLIEDCALALFSRPGGVPLGQDADLAIFSFPKTLPVPDGGAMVLRGAPVPQLVPRLTPPSSARILRRTLGLVKRRLQWTFRARSAGAATAAPRRRSRGFSPRQDMPANYYWDAATVGWSASRVTRGILRQLAEDEVVSRRRANHERLSAQIRGLPGVTHLFDDLPAGVCPLELPILVDQRDDWVAALSARGVAAVPWWAGYHRRLAWDGFPDACRLKDHLVALPIHQDLDGDLMDFIASQVAVLARAWFGSP